MMQQRTTITQHLVQPKRSQLFFHAPKTFRLLGSLLLDPSVAAWRKVLFLGSIGGLLFILLFPDLINEAVLSAALPIAGTVLGVPLDAGFDWVAFAMAIVTLMRFFPPEVVSMHYERIFGQ